MNTQIKLALAAASMTVLLAGCATGGGGYYGGQQQPYPGQNPPPEQQGGMNRTQKGALIGALAGVAAGLLSGDDATERRQRALIGAGVGGLAGGAIGNYQDRQERALRDRMAGTGVDVVRQGDNITLNMPSNITFAFNSANLDPQFY
jgi:outer membrane protein OmpA-like peptidoglycan-associated protein